jgi:hypothetical protein
MRIFYRVCEGGGRTDAPQELHEAAAQEMKKKKAFALAPKYKTELLKEASSWNEWCTRRDSRGIKDKASLIGRRKHRISLGKQGSSHVEAFILLHVSFFRLFATTIGPCAVPGSYSR